MPNFKYQERLLQLSTIFQAVHHTSCKTFLLGLILFLNPSLLNT